MDTEFFTPPRVQDYDPPPAPTGELTVNVEYQRQDRENWNLGVVETEHTGRVRVIIEGERERVAPYLTAVQKVMEREG